MREAMVSGATGKSAEREEAMNDFEQGEWEMFCLITSAWYGKAYYFMEPNGTVYSRASCKYLDDRESAYKEFLDYIGGHDI